MNKFAEINRLIGETNELVKQVIEHQRMINEFFEIQTDCGTISDNNVNDCESTKKPTVMDLEKVVAENLSSLGVPAHIKGYRYTLAAVLDVLNDEDMLQYVTKKLYPAIAKKFSTTSSRVERAIRHAIEIGWQRGDIKLQNEIFGYTVSAEKGKPTNSEFIATISEYIRLKLK